MFGRAVRGLFLRRTVNISRCFSQSPFLSSPVLAVVLSGSGVYDGSEVHEASAALVAATRAGADVLCFAPNEDQMHVIDHSKGTPEEQDTRNVLKESARIARGAIKPLSELTSQSADAVIFPGGFGAAKNLSNFAVDGPELHVKEDVERVINEFHSANKPIGLCCIAPVIAAKVLGSKGVELTVGRKDDGSGKWPYGGTVDAVSSLGAKAVEVDVDEIVVDEKNRVVTTPAFMYNGKFHEIHDGVAKMVNAVLKLLK